MSLSPSHSSTGTVKGSRSDASSASPHEESSEEMDMDEEVDELTSSDEEDMGLGTNGGQRERNASASMSPLSEEPGMDGGTEGSKDQRGQIHRRAAAHSRPFAQKPSWPPVFPSSFYPQLSPAHRVVSQPTYLSFLPYMSYPQMYAQGPPMPMHPSAYAPSPYAGYGMYPYDRPYSAPDPYDSRYSGGRPMPGYGMPAPYGYYSRPMTGMSDSSMSSMGSNPYSPQHAESPDRADAIGSHTRKRPGEHIPRPRNAFIFYRSWIIKSNLIPQSLEPDHRNLSRIAGEMWRKLTEEEREPYCEMARKEKEMHKLKYPKYRYTPAQRATAAVGPTDGGKRKVHRRPEADEEERKRCSEVAALLGKGVKGAELEKQIREEFKQSPPSTAKRVRPRQTKKSEEYNTDTGSATPPPAFPTITRDLRRSSAESHSPKETVVSPIATTPASATSRQFWTPSSLPPYAPSPRDARPFFAGTDNPHSFNSLASPADSVPTASGPFELIVERIAEVRGEVRSSAGQDANAADIKHSVSHERASEVSPPSTEGMQYCEPSANNDKFANNVSLYYDAMGHLPDFVNHHQSF